MGKLSFRSTLLMLVAVATATQILAADATHHSSKLRVGITLVEGAAATGAVCLDGTLPGYYLHPGHGSGANNWVIHLEGGGWCNSTRDCVDRTKTRGGSAMHMKKQKTFSGILSNKSEENPDFFNWNRVQVSYCDGASFAGEGEDKAAGLKYRGKRIFFAVVEDLMAKGMRHSHQVLLSGCSAGGNAVILRCDDFKSLFPRTSRVKCLADAGLFLDAVDISGVHRIGKLAHDVVRLQGIQKTLPQSCTSHHDPDYCFIPQYAIRYVRTPMFILQAAYDPTQIQVSVAPNTSDPDGKWYKCKLNIKNCSPSQIDILHAFRSKMVNVVQEFGVKKQNGFYIHSCFSHCQSEDRHTWFSDNSPQINNKRIALAVGDWYFDRASVKIIDCPYPCDKTCRHNHFNKSAY